MNTAINMNIANAVAASWTVPAIAQARSKRYAGTLQKAGSQYASIYSSIPEALRDIGVTVGIRSIRAAARDNAYVELEVEGQKYIIAALEISE